MNYEQTVPNDWKNLLESREKKKIILYNTSILMAEKDQNGYLEYLQGTLSAFYERREEVILLWYSTGFSEKDNLITETFKIRYDEIIAQYKKKNWGIFVEEEDWVFAKEIADLYYGDDIAKGLIFLVEGKDAIFVEQNMELYPETFLVDGDVFWAFLCNRSNGFGVGLFKISKFNWELKYIETPKSVVLKKTCFAKMLKKDQRLYFIPLGADYLAIYDIEHNTWENIPVNEPEYRVFFSSECKFITGEFFEDYLYLFSYCYPMIARYHIHTKQLEYLPECTKQIRILETNYFIFKSFSDGRYVTFYASMSKQILRFDMKEHTLVCLLDLNKCYPMYDYDIMEYDGTNYWMVTGVPDVPFLKYNAVTGNLYTIKNSREIAGVQYGSFIYSCVASGFIWLLPGLANKSLKINLITEDVVYAPEFEPNKQTPYKYYLLEKTEDALYTYDMDGMFVGYNLNTGERKKEALVFPKKEAAVWKVSKIIEYLTCQYSHTECEMLKKSLGIVQKSIILGESNCGKQIWEVCK